MAISNIDRAITFAPSEAIAASARRTGALRLIWDAFCKSYFAYHQYENLKSKGIPRRTALTRALGASPPPVE